MSFLRYGSSFRTTSALLVAGLLGMALVGLGTELPASASTPQACSTQFPPSAPPQVGGVYQVSEPAHLTWIVDGDTVFTHLTYDYEQTGDINLLGCRWTPLDGVAVAGVPGSKGVPSVDPVEGFIGSYDGGNFSLRGLFIDVDQLASVTQNEGQLNEYELFTSVGFIGYLNGGSLSNLRFVSPVLSFDLPSVAVGRASLEHVGIAVGLAEGATVTGVTIEDGQVSFDCDTANPTSAQCDITAVGGVVGSLQEGASTLSSVVASLTLEASAPDAPDVQDSANPRVLSLQPNGISMTSVGGILGRDTASSTLTNLRTSGEIVLDFPRVSELGGVVGRLQGTTLSRGSADVDMTLTNPRLFPDDSLTGGFLRVGGVAGFLDLGATLSSSRSRGAIDVDMEVIHLSSDENDGSTADCGLQFDPSTWVGTTATVWENSDRFDCSPRQGVAEVGGLVGALFDPSGSGPSIISSYSRSILTLDIADSVTVPGANPELAIEGVGALVGSVFQDQNTQSHSVASRSYAAGGVSITLGPGLSFGDDDDVFGVFLSRGSNNLLSPASMVGSWEPDDHSITESFWDQTRYASVNARGGTALDTAQMTSPSAFTTANWPLVSGYQVFEAGQREWGLCSGVNDGYPFLLWEFSSDPCPVSVSSTSSESSGSSSPPLETEALPEPAAPLALTLPRPEVSEPGNASRPAPENPEDALSGPQTNLPESRQPSEPESVASAWPLALGILGGVGAIGAAAVAWALTSSGGASSSGEARRFRFPRRM
jgi:hypothetical protein